MEDKDKVGGDGTTPNKDSSSAAVDNSSNYSLWFNGLNALLEDTAGEELFKEFLESRGSSLQLQFIYACEGLKHLGLTDSARRESLTLQLLKRFETVVQDFQSTKGSSTTANNGQNVTKLLDEAEEHVLTHLKQVVYPAFLQSPLFCSHVAQINGNVWNKAKTDSTSATVQSPPASSVEQLPPAIKVDRTRHKNYYEAFDARQQMTFSNHRLRVTEKKINDTAKTNPQSFAMDLCQRLSQPGVMKFKPQQTYEGNNMDEENVDDILDSHFDNCPIFDSPERTSPQLSVLDKAQANNLAEKLAQITIPLDVDSNLERQQQHAKEQQRRHPPIPHHGRHKTRDFTASSFSIDSGRVSSHTSGSGSLRRSAHGHSHECSKKSRTSGSRFGYEELSRHLKDLKRHPSIASFDSGFSRSTGASSSSSSASRGINKFVDIHITYEEFKQKCEMKMTRMPGTFGSGVTLQAFQMTLPKTGDFNFRFRYYFETMEQECGNKVVKVEITNPCQELPMINGKIYAHLTVCPGSVGISTTKPTQYFL